jgi:hypothetical protein
LPLEVIQVWKEVAMHVKSGTQGELFSWWFDSIQKMSLHGIQIHATVPNNL